MFVLYIGELEAVADLPREREIGTSQYPLSSNF
jgi:hypothetical protein